MKKSLFILVCLMATSAFATTSWTGNGGDGMWSNGDNWSLGVVPDDTPATGQTKITKDGASITLDIATATFSANKPVLGSSTTGSWATLNLVSGGTFNLANEFQIGNAAATSNGRVVQTGGTMSVVSGSTTAKLEIGYKGGVGEYTINGGTMTGSSSSQLIVGGAGTPGSKGTFTVVGNAATIGVGRLYLGTKDSTGGYAGTGTLDFEVGATGVSAISTQNAITVSGGASVSNLIVNLTGATPTGDILLVENINTGAVVGTFSNHAWGSTFNLGTGVWTLSNVYDSVSHTNGSGNDIALVYVPEPATIALLGLGLLAMRRNKK